MQTEIEAKFLKVDINAVRAKLQAAGASCEQPMRLMQRVVFHTTHNNPNAYVRVRAEGNKSTLTYKQFDELGLHGAKEIETTIGDYQQTVELLKAAGLQVKSLQETKRETWKLGEAEVVIDEWPWLEPFIEIEGPSEESVRDAAAQLEFDWSTAVFGGATEAYRASYPNLPATMVMDDVPDIRFDTEPPARLKGEQ
ncbi:MAG TPA: class IV adenylate cyclase [Candidatus Saccharibacteria bacterium]|nr:class IV adenylate cyclase [Candidatus Saccharibacteria bacterium]